MAAPSLWRNPDFSRLWIGQTISLLGSQIGGGALRFAAILALGATAQQLSMLTIAALAPTLILVLPIGLWADRVRRRPLLIAADLGRALLLLSIPLAYALGILRIEYLYLVAIAAGALTLLFDVAYPSYIPSVVGRDELVEANSKLRASDSAAEIAGPPLGGALVQWIGAPFAILLDALSFLGSALALGGIRANEPPPSPPERTNLRVDLTAGFAVLIGDPILRTLALVAATQSLGGGIIGSLYDIYIIRDLGMSPAIVGLTIGVGGVSALFGALLAERLSLRLGLGNLMLMALSFDSIASLLLPLAREPWALAMLMAAQAADAAGTIYAIHGLSLRQRVADDATLGRVNAAFLLLETGCAIVGALAAGILAEPLGMRLTIGIGVGMGILAPIWMAVSPVRRLRSMTNA